MTKVDQKLWNYIESLDRKGDSVPRWLAGQPLCDEAIELHSRMYSLKRRIERLVEAYGTLSCVHGGAQVVAAFCGEETPWGGEYIDVKLNIRTAAEAKAAIRHGIHLVTNNGKLFVVKL